MKIIQYTKIIFFTFILITFKWHLKLLFIFCLLPLRFSEIVIIVKIKIIIMNFVFMKDA